MGVGTFWAFYGRPRRLIICDVRGGNGSTPGEKQIGRFGKKNKKRQLVRTTHELKSVHMRFAHREGSEGRNIYKSRGGRRMHPRPLGQVPFAPLGTCKFLWLFYTQVLKIYVLSFVFFSAFTIMLCHHLSFIETFIIRLGRVRARTGPASAGRFRRTRKSLTPSLITRIGKRLSHIRDRFWGSWGGSYY